MSDYYTITGEHSGHGYLVTRDGSGGIGLFRRWYYSDFGGLSYYPQERIHLPRNPRRADRKSRRIIKRWEAEKRAADRAIEKGKAPVPRVNRSKQRSPEVTDIVEQAARVMAGGEEYADGYMPMAQSLADAGLLTQPARTVPTREELAEVLTYALTGAGIDDYREYSGEEGLRAYYRMADAALALMHNQPTVAEAKAQALEEAADDLEADLGTTGPGNRRTGYGAVALDLLRLIRNRAQQIRDGK